MRNDDQRDEAAIAALRQRWIEAMADGDAGRLAEFMTEDIVVVHGNGRTVSGRETVAEDLRRYFATGAISQVVEPQEIVVSADWAFERAMVRSSLRAAGSERSTEVTSNTWTLLRRDPGAGWRVARTIGVVVS